MVLCDNQWKFWTFFNTLTLIQIFSKTKTFFEKLEYHFLVETTKIENTSFPFKLLCQTPMLRQIEWRLQNWPTTNSGVLPVTALFFWEICFSFSTSCKELIWCTNDPNVHIRIFRKSWSLIFGCFFPVSILKFTYFYIVKIWTLKIGVLLKKISKKPFTAIKTTTKDKNDMSQQYVITSSSHLITVAL